MQQAQQGLPAPLSRLLPPLDAATRTRAEQLPT